MAIDLLHHLSEQIQKVHTTVENGGTESISDAEAAKVLRAVYALKPGDSLQGELLSVNGKEISLLLGNAVPLHAKMDKGLYLQTGQLMNFIVSSNQNGKLSLQPLFTNVGLEQNALKALDAANIPISDKTVALTEEMMKQGLAVNKDSLQMMFRAMTGNPDAELMDLVMTQKMQIPLTKDNISMMHLYETNQQTLFQDFQGLSLEMAEFLLTYLQEMEPKEAEGFMREFFSAFYKNQPSLSNGNQDLVFLQEGNTGKETGKPVSLEQIVEQEDFSGNATIHLKKEGDLPFLQDLSLDDQKSQQALKQLIFWKGDGKETAGKELALFVHNFLKEQFLMKPEEVANPNYVKEFYRSLHGKMVQLEQLLKNSGKGESSLTKHITTVKNNIQFMNQINELYHYIQLPLNMNQEAASGDLYVYKRKQAKTGEDGNLTALLHLSMPHLGKMDIFLSLKEEKLSTRFCMEKEEDLRFIESHLQKLNERLIKKGYAAVSTVALTEEKDKTVMEHIMEKEGRIPINSDTSFDARC